jgi:hypothetical protein
MEGIVKFSSFFASAALVVGLCASASAQFVINELDSDTPGTDALEFVELLGPPNTQATGLILVFYNGNGSPTSPTSYRTIDIGGLTSSANGRILVGNAAVPGVQLTFPNNILQNGEDAVALYSAPAASFPNGTLPTTTDLIDVVVYEAAAQADCDWSVFGSPKVYRENWNGAVTEYGLTRYPEGSGEFYSALPTPGEPTSQIQNYTAALSRFFPRMNQATALEVTTRTVTIQNKGVGPMTLSSLGLDTGSSSAFSTLDAPAVPLTLFSNDSAVVTVQFLDTNVSANKAYPGSVTFASDNTTTPTGSVDLSTELVRASQTANVGDVMINEVCYAPGTVDHNNDGSTANQNDEFVELINMTASPIVIEGWEQRCTDGDNVSTFHSYVFPAGATIPANGFVTVFTSGTPIGFTPGTTFTYGVPRIRNTGAFVGIHDAAKLVDGVGYLDAGADDPDADGYTNAGVAIAAGGSIGRRPDGSASFRTFNPLDEIETDRPTPNASNNGATSVVTDWALF